MNDFEKAFKVTHKGTKMKTKEIHKIVCEGETINISKGRFGWAVVFPIKNEDGSINWFNLLTGGSWARIIMIGVLVLLICLAIWEYTHNIKILMSCFDNPIALRECTQSFNPSLLFGS